MKSAIGDNDKNIKKIISERDLLNRSTRLEKFAHYTSEAVGLLFLENV